MTAETASDLSYGGNKTDVSIFGQESNPTTWRLAHINLAIHSIEANLGPAPADTFLRDAHPDLKADFVLANPPFNVSDYSGPLLRGKGYNRAHSVFAERTGECLRLLP